MLLYSVTGYTASFDVSNLLLLLLLMMVVMVVAMVMVMAMTMMMMIAFLFVFVCQVVSLVNLKLTEMRIAVLAFCRLLGKYSPLKTLMKKNISWCFFISE